MSAVSTSPLASDHHRHLLRCYLAAKDDQEVHHFAQVFAPTATFQSLAPMAPGFSMPAPVRGPQGIAATLATLPTMVEGLVTVCVEDGARFSEDRMACRWITAMVERGTGRVRVLHGRYRWSLEGAQVAGLEVRAEGMVMLPPDTAAGVTGWLVEAARPLSGAGALLETAPEHPELASLLAWIAGP